MVVKKQPLLLSHPNRKNMGLSLIEAAIHDEIFFYKTPPKEIHDLLGISKASFYGVCKKLVAKGFDIPFLNKPIYIYVMLDKSTGFVKIGKSKSPNSREKTLQSEKPTIEMILCFLSTSNLEKVLHLKFSEKRVRGEWFNLSESDIEFIKSHPNES